MSEAKEMLSVEEFAEFMNVNRKTVYDSIKANEFPGVMKMKGTLRIHKATVLAWIADGASPVKQRKQSR